MVLLIVFDVFYSRIFCSSNLGRNNDSVRNISYPVTISVGNNSYLVLLTFFQIINNKAGALVLTDNRPSAADIGYYCIFISTLNFIPAEFDCTVTLFVSYFRCIVYQLRDPYFLSIGIDLAF